MKYTLETIITEYNAGTQQQYLFFWGHQPSKDGFLTNSCFSQWWQQDFSFEGLTYFCAEQWMMAEKARLFQDYETLPLILEAGTPKECKSLGRKIKNFHEDKWDKNKGNIVLFGNYLKFSQNSSLSEFLLQTNNDIIAEASPYDKIWGIGMKAGDININNPGKWRGKNLLGFIIMEVRDAIRNNLPVGHVEFI